MFSWSKLIIFSTDLFLPWAKSNSIIEEWNLFNSVFIQFYCFIWMITPPPRQEWPKSTQAPGNEIRFQYIITKHIKIYWNHVNGKRCYLEWNEHRLMLQINKVKSCNNNIVSSYLSMSRKTYWSGRVSTLAVFLPTDLCPHRSTLTYKALLAAFLQRTCAPDKKKVYTCRRKNNRKYNDGSAIWCHLYY